MAHRSFVIALSVVLGIAAPTALAAGNPEHGKNKAFMCNVCHGVDGKTQIPRLQGGVVTLAGMEQQKMLDAIKAYRSGQNFHPLMQIFVLPMSEQDAADVAAYYAGLR